MSDTKFIIDLDIQDLNDQVDSVHRSYTELGAALRSVSQDTSVQLNSLVAASVSPPVKVGLPSSFDQSIDRIAAAIKEVSHGVTGLQNVVRSMSSASPVSSSATAQGDDPQDAAADDALNKLQHKRSQYDSLMDGVDNRTDSAFKDAQKALDRNYERNNKLVKFIEGEISKAKSKIKEIFSNLPGSLSSGFIGAIIGCIALGYEEMNRKRAEMGEMANVFEAGVDKVTGAGARVATRWFWQWGERAQWYWGVGRKEVQGAIKLMVDNGFQASEMLESFDKDLGRVGHNVVTLSIGLGKHYNYSTAKSMENVVVLVRDYGMELQDAGNLYLRMSAAGERASAGVYNFSRTVLAASAPMSQMGINAESVAVFVEKLIGFYKDMKLDSRFAGHEAEGVAVDLLTAFTKLDDNMKLVLARDMYGRDDDGRQLLVKFSEGLQRVAKGEDENFLENLVRSYIKTIIKPMTPERSRAIAAIQQNLRVENRTAALVWDVGEKLAEGGKLEEMSKESRSALQKAFKTEGEQVSDLFKTKRGLITAISEIGSGIMTILIAIIASLILGLKGLYYTIAAPPPGENNRNIRLRIYYGNLSVYKLFGQGWDKIMKGGADGVHQLMGADFMQTFNPVLDAMTMDIMDKGAGKDPSKRGPVAVKDSWSEVFGDKTQEEMLAEEDAQLKGTGLVSVKPKSPNLKLTSPTDLAKNAALGFLSDVLLGDIEVGPDQPMDPSRDLNPQGPVPWVGQGPSPIQAPPPDNTGQVVQQLDVQMSPGLSPHMSEVK